MSQPTAQSRPLLAVGCATRVKLPRLLLGILVQMALDSLMGFHFSMKSLCAVFQCCVSTSFSSSFVQQLGQLPCFVIHFGMAVAEPALHLKKMENMPEDTTSPRTCETLFKSFDFSLRWRIASPFWSYCLFTLAQKFRKQIFLSSDWVTLLRFEPISELLCFETPTLQEWCMNNESKEKSSLLFLGT